MSARAQQANVPTLKLPLAAGYLQRVQGFQFFFLSRLSSGVFCGEKKMKFKHFFSLVAGLYLPHLLKLIIYVIPFFDNYSHILVPFELVLYPVYTASTFLFICV